MHYRRLSEVSGQDLELALIVNKIGLLVLDICDVSSAFRVINFVTVRIATMSQPYEIYY